jgi:hypothetical protein
MCRRLHSHAVLHIVQGLAAYVASLIDRTLQWKDIQWLRTVCNLPVSMLTSYYWILADGLRPTHRHHETGEVAMLTGINRFSVLSVF